MRIASPPGPICMGTILYENYEQGFGEEYPAVILIRGVRVPLRLETRFIRYFPNPEPWLPRQNDDLEISRFVDGSVTVTLAQLPTEWAAWTEHDRMDFCRSIDDLQLLEQPDLPAMVEFIVHHANYDELSCVAPCVPRIFPQEEAFRLLLVALENSAIGHGTNIVQAIAGTKHPQAIATLRTQLQSVLNHSALWEDASFVNWVAYEGVYCIRYLIELGAPPVEFEELARKFAQHPCRRIRQSCLKLFSRYYAGLDRLADS